MKAEPAVEVRGLRKRFGQTEALRGLDLEIEHGAVFGLLGPNGAGKTTTFGILCGWLSPTAGSARVLGTPCQKLHRLRGRVAALPQDAQFPAQVTVAAQLAHFGRLMGLSAAQAGREAARVLEEVGLPEAAGLRGDKLSHGQAKRVALAQALMGPPDLVFLDEPTAGLDPRSAHQIKRLIASLAPRTTVVLSSHNLVDVQEICTHGTVIHHGETVAQGSMEALTRRADQVTVLLGPGAKLPMIELHARFGDERVRKGRQHDLDTLTVAFSSRRQASEVIAELLTLLLEHRVPILGVTRGTSLEAAFLEVTEASRPTPAAER